MRGFDRNCEQVAAAVYLEYSAKFHLREYQGDILAEASILYVAVTVGGANRASHRGPRSSG